MPDVPSLRSIGLMQKNHVIAADAALTAKTMSIVLMLEYSPRVHGMGAALRRESALNVKRQPLPEAGSTPALVRCCSANCRDRAS
jgi:hypothetical protein